MIPSTLSCWRTQAAARNPEEPAVRLWPLKNEVSAALSIVPASMAAELPESADATPISAQSPLLEAAGFVIAKWKEPSADLASMSFQVTFGLLSQPNLWATDCFTPMITGLSMILFWATIRLPALGSSDR